MDNKFLLPIALLIICLSGCGYRNQEISRVQNGRPIIYDAWDARYAYQMENRKLVPLHQGREVGRTWGRDEQGKINHSMYLSANQENVEDLYVLHASHLDRQREKKWDKSKEQRLDFIKGQMEILEEEENAPLIEVPLEEIEDDFVPPAFLPQGIDLNSIEDPVENDGMPPAFPFAPLP